MPRNLVRKLIEIIVTLVTSGLNVAVAWGAIDIAHGLAVVLVLLLIGLYAWDCAVDRHDQRGLGSSIYDQGSSSGNSNP